MQLAMESTVLTIDGYRFVLRPTLRAAARLESIYGGFKPLIDTYSRYEFKALADIVVESSDDGDAAYDRLCKVVGSFPVNGIYDAIGSSIGTHLAHLVGYDPDVPADAPVGPPMSFTEYHDALFRIGTGWLGWTPEQTWNATPLEIIRARAGFIEMQQALRGTVDPEQRQSGEITKEEFKARSQQRIGQRIR